MRMLRRAAVLLLLAGSLGGLAVYRSAQPYRGFSGEAFVEFAHGTGTGTMAEALAHAGVVRSKWDFLLARLVNRGGVLQAGEYRFTQAASPAEIVSRIRRGDVFYYELLVPEGKNMFDIAASAEDLGLFKSADFLAEARKPEMIRDLDPKAPTLEGYLFPGTYRLNRHTTPERLCRTMTAKFRETWATLKTDANVHDTMALASLVEKEGKLAEERPYIAAVFANRLKIGMKLDCDPTTIYAALLENHYRGTIYRSDLDRDHPYNTYRSLGLPPGPIANPGLPSIRAALAPAQVDSIYFVARADGSGGHQFSSNLAAHNQAVNRYHSALRKLR